METLGVAPRVRYIGLLVLATFVALSGIALAKAGEPTSGVVYAGVTHAEGDDLYVSGDFKDELLGRGAIVYVTRVSADDAGSILVEARKITIYTRHGSLTGKGSATQTFNDDGTSTVTDGKFKLKKGTGDYEGNKFKGTFDGDYADGVYTFDYAGEFK